MGTNPGEHFDEELMVIPAGARFWQYARAPRYLGACADASASATGVGSCGDKLHVDLCIENHTIVKFRCKPKGCVYTLVCASALGALAEGCTIDEALQLQPEDVARELERLPDDHMHCARLAVNTLGDAIAEYYRLQMLNAKGKINAPTNYKGG